jgi:hypothetical protein
MEGRRHSDGLALHSTGDKPLVFVNGFLGQFVEFSGANVLLDLSAPFVVMLPDHPLG